MAVLYGEALYSPSAAWVASRTYADGTYGTPVAIDEFQMYNFEVEVDTDERKNGGAFTAGLAVPTKVVQTIGISTLQSSALAVISTYTTAETGVTPNRTRSSTLPAGGAGFPYFGIIVKFVAEGGSILVIGQPKSMLQAFPSPENEQNEWATYELEAAGYRNDYGSSQTSVLFWEAYETPGDFTDPTTANAFDTFFSVGA